LFGSLYPSGYLSLPLLWYSFPWQGELVINIANFFPSPQLFFNANLNAPATSLDSSSPPSASILSIFSYNSS
jgi:hypothetical protein